ncbi:MAG: ThiF family adenylyltransferase, partial [Phycisphaerae bacterium]|nr:ThiF family adenylyltransferase [Phycisphaerae bacterium]MDW8262432.1 ThiF family adenylyltransferase [Phycisphaerales bacterium]
MSGIDGLYARDSTVQRVGVTAAGEGRAGLLLRVDNRKEFRDTVSNRSGATPGHAMTEPLRLELEEDRFARFRLIGWWDQQKLGAAKVVVIGAGALGNEIIKNLALLGVGNVLICDKDRIEHSNLSRSVL